MTIDQQTLAAIRENYPYLDTCVFVDHAAISPLSRSIQAAMNERADRHVMSVHDVMTASQARYDHGRRLAARLVGGNPDRIAYIDNTSHGMSMCALGIDWRPGDNVVVPALEFPSNFLAWLQLEALGVEVRKLQGNNGQLDPATLAKLVDDRTRVVAVSHVQFYSGFRADVAAFAEVCRKHDAMLIVDGTQSIGALGLDVGKSGVDVLVVSAHKWLLGPAGIGFMALSARAMERITPRIVGWLSVSEPFAFKRQLNYLPSARRFEPGTENGTGIFGLVQRLEEIDSIGIAAIERRIMHLIDLLREVALSSGIILPMDHASPHRSGIVLMRRDDCPSELLLENLKQRGVRCGLRNGSIRISPHHYNTEAEMHSVVTAIRDVRAGDTNYAA